MNLFDLTKHITLDKMKLIENDSCDQPQLIGSLSSFRLVWFGFNYIEI